MNVDLEDDFEENEEKLKENFIEQRVPVDEMSPILKERFIIAFNEPVEWLDNNGAKAYKVHDKVDPKRELFALICNNETAPRSSYLSYIKSLDHHSIMRLIEYGTINYPETGSQHLALVYQTPLGGRVMDAKPSDYLLRNNYEKFKYVLLRLLAAIENLRGFKATHRAIRFDNLYYKDVAKTEIVVGDCIASFPAFHQPPIYETIESLMAQKEGRGNGDETNDIYAVGVTMLVMFLGYEMFQDLSLPEILRLKFKKNSFTALVGDEIITSQYANIFRGLLNDNTENRWSYIQTYNYLEGKSGSFQAIIHERPRKSITINGEKVHEVREVAFAMQKSPEETYELIKSGKILDWIKNGIANENLTTRVKYIIDQDLLTNVRPEILVSKICILIYPRLPIKIKELAVFPDGASKAMFYFIKTQESLEPFYTLFSSDLIKLWYQEQQNTRSPANANELKIYINSKDIGYGIDRIIYDFDADLPCLSPLLGNDFINTSTKILPSLDRAYSKKRVDTPPYDKNLIAYLRCKMGKKLDKVISNLNSNDESKKASAILRLYTSMQIKYGPTSLPNLTQWISQYAKNIIKSYHNIKYQKYLEKEILKVSSSGRLNDILKILENEDAYKKDILDFNKAKKEASALMSEKNNLVNNERKIYSDAKKLGLRVASIIAAVAMISSLIFNAVEWMTK